MKIYKNKSDELKQTIQDDINSSESKLSTIKALSDAAPFIQDRKEELETLRDTLEILPEDVVEEIAPRLLLIHRDSYHQFQTRIPDLPQFDSAHISANSSTGTASIYQAEISDLYKTYQSETWVKTVITTFDELAQNKVRKSNLPIKLEKIDSNLPPLFSAVSDSYEKSKSGIVGLDNAAIRIRDLIEKLWGALVSRAKIKCGSQIGINRLEIKKPKHREKVADCLAAGANTRELLLVLDQLSQLKLDLSKPAKNPMFGDGKLLHDFYTRLILQIDALFGWIDL